jgi:hypothetical protein
MSSVIEQLTLHLTESLFGSSSFFQVLKFPGGITIIPLQAAFLVQKPYASFNFTLNFPIYEVKDKTNELKDQMKAGLRLNSYEVGIILVKFYLAFIDYVFLQFYLLIATKLLLDNT